jgi:hypothetical protein
VSDPGNPEAPSPAPRPAAGAGRSGSVKNPWPFIGFVVVLGVAGWLLVSWMSNNAHVQDCGMSGRKDCVPIDPQSGR